MRGRIEKALPGVQSSVNSLTMSDQVKMRGRYWIVFGISKYERFRFDQSSKSRFPWEPSE